MSNQPLASSPRSLNGTGYGTLNGKNLNEKAALSNWKRIRFPSFIDAAACKRKRKWKVNPWENLRSARSKLNVCNIADKNARNIESTLWHFYGQIVFKQLKKKATEVAFSFDKLWFRIHNLLEEACSYQRLIPVFVLYEMLSNQFDFFFYFTVI